MSPLLWQSYGETLFCVNRVILLSQTSFSQVNWIILRVAYSLALFQSSFQFLSAKPDFH